MKKILLFLLCTFLSVSAFSQGIESVCKSKESCWELGEKFAPCHIGLGFPLSTYDLEDGKKYTVAFFVNALIGTAGDIKGVAVAGAENIIYNDAYGLQVAGMVNEIHYNAYGISVAGLANLAEYYYGIQVAGFANAGRNSFYGMQIGGVLNSSSNANGLIIGGVNNIAFDTLDGMQIAGVVNYAKEARGVQIAGVTNIAGDVKGLQFAAVANIAKKVKGVQFATLLNIAEESNFPIAFINIIKNGKMGVALSYDMMNNAMLSFRSGGKYTYGILGVGYNNLVNDGSKVVAEAGYGIHIPINDWIEINNEFKATSVGFSDDKTCSNFSYLLAPSFTFKNHYNVFGGASFNYLNTNYVNSNDLMPNNYFWSKDGNYNQRMYIGYQIGLQYVF